MLALLGLMVAGSGVACGVEAPQNECVDASALDPSATDGMIEAGPFHDNAAYWAQPQGTKFWVGSRRDDHGHPPGATIRAEPLDGGHPAVTVHRPPREQVRNRDLLAFYPGAFRIPSTGPWRITVTIGPDHGCFITQVEPVGPAQ